MSRIEKPSNQIIGRICVIDPESLAREFARYELGECNVVQLSNKHFFLEAIDTKPASGFELPVNFPECCDPHKDLYRSLVEDFNRFPDCCPRHRLLLGASWFKKENYLYAPMKTILALVYTMHWITTHINDSNWFKKIYDYIEHTCKSYGQLPVGYGNPVGLQWYASLVTGNIPLLDDVPSEKLEQLLTIIPKLTGSKTGKPEIDLDMLIGIYKEWLRIFPFELPYLSQTEKHFENNFPILKGPGETNSYTGTISFKLRSKKELLEFLTEITEYMITELSAGKLYENGKLSTSEETELKVLTARRRLEIEELKTTTNPDVKVYIKQLRKWLKGEKNFISDLRTVLKADGEKQSFLKALTDGIKQLQQNDTNEPCLVNIRNGGPDKESGVRYWFKNFLSARFPAAVIPAEEQNGPGRMDLKFYQPGMADKVIEFKGWWNFDKQSVAGQVIKYLTDFEGEGFIIMINHLKSKEITEAYSQLLQKPEMNFQVGSWTAHPVENSAFNYYSSVHLFGAKSKQLYHIIFNIYF